MKQITQLTELARLYAEATNLPQTTVSWRLFDDSKILSKLNNGGDITVGRYWRAVKWLSDNWPEGFDWPDFISRTSPDLVGHDANDDDGPEGLGQGEQAA